MRQLISEMRADRKRRYGVLMWLSGSGLLGGAAQFEINYDLPIWVWPVGVVLIIIGFAVDPKGGR